MSATVFAATISTALNYYKSIIRKSLDPQAAEEKIKQLRLKRIQLRNANELILYQTAENVIKTIEQEVLAKTDGPTWHFGIADFMQYLKNTLDEYIIENNQIIHSKQNASRAIVEAIQLVSLPAEKITHTQKNRLDKCTQVIAKYGTKEQHTMLSDILKKRMEHNVSLFDMMLQRLKFYATTTSENWATI